MSEKTMMAALDRVTKWRRFFVSWQLGTRPDNDGAARAIARERELYIVLRVETTSLLRLLIEKGIVTEQEVQDTIEDEANRLNEAYAEAYPGWTADEKGLTMELPTAHETMHKLGFPP